MIYPVKHISISINKPTNEVYQFASNPEHMAKWVGFIKSVTRENDLWFAHSDLGKIQVNFAARNNFGIMDHAVTLPDGETVNNPFRVIPNDKGSELIFTLFHLPGRTEEDFNQDAKAVKSDLHTLKTILESQ